jgi:hypothetical protein
LVPQLGLYGLDTVFLTMVAAKKRWP